MHGAASEIIRSTLFIFGALFPIVNPLGNAPIFLSFTPGLSSATRALLARKIAVNGFVILLVSILIGTYILAFFGISLAVVQVAGGLVVMAAGWTLLRSDDEHPHPEGEPKWTGERLAQKAFYPLTLPLTVGPGSISVAITVGASRPESAAARWPWFVAAVAGPALIALSVYLSCRSAEKIARTLGDTAMKVIIKLSSFILLCIGVQILWNGVSALLNSLRLG